MPPKKRALSTTDGNAAAPSAPKRSARGRKVTAKENAEPAQEALSKPASTAKTAKSKVAAAKGTTKKTAKENVDPAQEVASKSASKAKNAKPKAVAAKPSTKETAEEDMDPTQQVASTLASKAKTAKPKTAAVKSTPKATAKSKPSAKSTVTDPSAKVPPKAPPKTWICICRPKEDIKRSKKKYKKPFDDEDSTGSDEDDEAESESEDEEDSSLDNEEEEEEPDRQNQHCGNGSKCMCLRYASAHPTHTWIFTYKGYTTGNEWIIQQEKRNQDNFDVHIYNDWSGYGVCEVMENVFVAFDKEIKKHTTSESGDGKGKGKRDVMPLWAQIEGLALWLTRDLGAWSMIEDSEGNAKRVMLLGTMVLSAVDVLVENGVFNASGGDGKIKNLGLVICYLLDFAYSSIVTDICELNEDGWARALIDKAEEEGVEITGFHAPYVREMIENIQFRIDNHEPDQWQPTKFEDVADCYGSPPTQSWGLLTVEKLEKRKEEAENLRRPWYVFDWEIELEAYREERSVKVGWMGTSYGAKLGGNHYDLTTKTNQKVVRQKQEESGEVFW